MPVRARELVKSIVRSTPAKFSHQIKVFPPTNDKRKFYKERITRPRAGVWGSFVGEGGGVVGALKQFASFNWEVPRAIFIRVLVYKFAINVILRINNFSKVSADSSTLPFSSLEVSPPIFLPFGDNWWNLPDTQYS